MNNASPIRAFSLIELLVGISVVAIVAAVIIPRFLNVQTQADNTIAKQIQDELNTTYASWKASGGLSTATTNYGSLILDVLSSPAATTSPLRSPDNLAMVADGGTSSIIRIASLPPGTPNLSPSVTPVTNAVISDNFLITYSNGNDQFDVIPTTGLSWTSANWPSDSILMPLNGTYTVTKNGVTFGVLACSSGVLTNSGTSGSLYASDPTSGNILRADYSLIPPIMITYTPIEGYTRFQMLGASAAPPIVSTLMLKFDYFVAATSNRQ